MSRFMAECPHCGELFDDEDDWFGHVSCCEEQDGPEVVAWMWRDINGDVQFNYMHPNGEPLIRLTDHERLQAEAERLQADHEAERAADKARIAELEAANAINMPGLLDDLDEALEEIALRGRHDDYGYQQLRAWYSKMRRVTRTVDAALSQQGKEGEA